MITQKELNNFAKEQSWNAQHNKGGLDGPGNYSGPDYGDMVVVVGRSSDSDIMAESNFETALDMLGNESDNVTVERFGHWGCGWFELIMVNPKSKKHLKIAYEIHKSLENYPILDESDYSERWSEKYSEYAQNAKKSLASNLSKHFGVKNGKALERLAYELNIEEQYYSGEDGCIDIYSRDPDKRNIKQLKRALEAISYGNNKSIVYRNLVKAVNAYQVKE